MNEVAEELDDESMIALMEMAGWEISKKEAMLRPPNNVLSYRIPCDEQGPMITVAFQLFLDYKDRI